MSCYHVYRALDLLKHSAVKIYKNCAKNIDRYWEQCTHVQSRNLIFQYISSLQTDRVLFTSLRSLCSLVFMSSDLIRSFRAVSRSSSSSVMRDAIAAMRSFIWPKSAIWRSIASWSSPTLPNPGADSSSWLDELSDDRCGQIDIGFKMYIQNIVFFFLDERCAVIVGYLIIKKFE